MSILRGIHGRMSIIDSEDGFEWDQFMVLFTDERFSYWWAPFYIMDNIYTRLMYMTRNESSLYFICGVFEGYHREP